MDWTQLRPPDEQTRFDEAFDRLVRAMGTRPEAVMKVMLNKFILAAREAGRDSLRIHQMVEDRYNHSVKNKESTRDK